MSMLSGWLSPRTVQKERDELQKLHKKVDMLQDKIKRNRTIFEKERYELQKKNNNLIELSRIEKETFQKEKLIFTQQYGHMEKECEVTKT